MALGGISSPSACVASSSRMLSGALPKSHQISVCAPTGNNFAGRIGLPRESRRTFIRASATDSLQAVESQPEPVEAQIASVVAGEVPKGEEVFAVIMVSVEILL